MSREYKIIIIMKTTLKLTIAICCIFSFIQTQAQIKFGPEVGLNLSTMTLKSSGISLDPKSLIGFHVGVIAEIPLIENFVLQPGVLYSAKGSKYSFDGEDMSISPSFIEIPVNALYKLDIHSAKLLLFAGPYFGFGIGGSYKNSSGSTEIKYGSGEDKDMKPFDLGINIGAGIEISKLQLKVQYGLGITNLAPVTTDDQEMKIRSFGISMAYLLGGK
jgi:hypothetical protein